MIYLISHNLSYDKDYHRISDIEFSFFHSLTFFDGSAIRYELFTVAEGNKHLK